MAETLISPGVLALENDNSFVSSQPVTVGAALVGPTVKGPVEVPTIVTSWSDYQNRFGTTFLSGSNVYTYFTSIAAYNYFANGGQTLLVSRVTSGSFTSATSTAIYNGLESGDVNAGTNLLGSYTSGGTGGSAGTYSAVATTTSGTGTGITLNVTTSTDNGKILTTADALLSSITSNPTDCDDATYTGVALTGGSGTGAVATVVCSGNTITSITVTTAGSGYEAGDVLTIAALALGTASSAATITLVSGDLLVETTAVAVVTAGTGYAVGDTVTVALGLIGSPSANLVLTLVAGDIENSDALVLKTLSQGVIMNSSGSEDAYGALESGSVNNVRFQITNNDTASGTFTLLVRQGDDTTTNRTILESWTNLSMDPTAPNYVSRVIGDQYKVYNSTDNQIVVNGTYPNNSRYIYVSAVNSPTPNYFDNAGLPKSQYTASIPLNGSGSFTGAVGDLFGAGAKFYDNIVSGVNNIQGLDASDYDNMIALMSNADDYRYNVLLTPGLFASESDLGGAQVTTAINNTQYRGDAIYVADLVPYGSSISTVTSQANAKNTSYAASYWPWVQTIDPSSTQLVWVPASAMIGGVYAYNDSVSEPWFAPAGINRGGLSTVVRAEKKLSQANRDTLYSNKVNPIATFPGTGVVVYGQKTLQTRASALDRVNVRRLLIALKSYISQVANNLVFEQNTIATRTNFLNQVNPYLESVQQRQGLYAFKVIMDDSNNTPDVIDRNQMVGQIYLQPTKTAEFIYLDFNILPTGATFPA